MCEIKLLDDNFDYSSLKPLDWDLVIHDVPYFVYRVDGYYHSLGGRNNNNDNYCCSRSEIPSKDTLIEYDNRFGPVNWGIVCQEDSRLKCKWNETRTRQYIECYITRNGKRFYDITGGSFEYSMSKAYTTLIQLQEHTIEFNSIYWKNELLNRKIWWRSMPCIITSIVENQGCIIVKKEDGSDFTSPPEFKEKDDFQEYDSSVKLDYLDPHIWWWRDDR